MSTELLEFGDDFTPWKAATTQELVDRIDAASSEVRETADPQAGRSSLVLQEPRNPGEVMRR